MSEKDLKEKINNLVTSFLKLKGEIDAKKIGYVYTKKGKTYEIKGVHEVKEANEAIELYDSKGKLIKKYKIQDLSATILPKKNKNKEYVEMAVYYKGKTKFKIG